LHCELIVPALLPAGVEDIKQALGDLRLPSLELLLARSRRTAEEAVSLERWLAETFDANDEVEIPAGALSVIALGGEAGDATWMRADPAHLRLNRDQLVLVPAAAFEIKAAEAESLAETLNKHFSGQLTFFPLSAERWCVRLEGSSAEGLRTETPAEVAGKDINRHLPTGGGSKRWHSLLNEIQMLLHEHPVNEARESRGEPVVNSVWLWGAGRLPGDSSAAYQSVTADDPVAQGYAKAAKLRHRSLPANADEWLARLPEEGRQLLVLDGLRMPLALGDFDAWRQRVVELEERWFAPLLAALKAGRIGMVTVRVPDAADLKSFETTHNDQRHFWRRPKALGSYY
jgi:hypothetical protein